ncbi:MAG: hypothetical protein ACKVU0_09355 [Saprospiraceae bacterium]
MKNAFFAAATLVFLFACQSSLCAQKTATWKGGTPGRVSNWECATNWKEGRVPDEFSCVIIPDVSTSTFSYPVITDEVEVMSLLCASSARLTVMDNASLIITLPISKENEAQRDGFIRISSQDGFAVLSGK